MLLPIPIVDLPDWRDDNRVRRQQRGGNEGRREGGRRVLVRTTGRHRSGFRVVNFRDPRASGRSSRYPSGLLPRPSPSPCVEAAYLTWLVFLPKRYPCRAPKTQAYCQPRPQMWKPSMNSDGWRGLRPFGLRQLEVFSVARTGSLLAARHQELA
jgi:hypothetical protein